MKKTASLLLSFVLSLSLISCGGAAGSSTGTNSPATTAAQATTAAAQGTDSSATAAASEKSTATAASKESSEAAATETGSGGTRVITDMRGREVEIPVNISRFICTGGTTLRIVSYLQATDQLVGVEELEQKEPNPGRDYDYVYHDLFKKLPPIARGGGRSYKAYPEQILAVQPEMILTTYVDDALKQLSDETGIPCVAIDYKGDGLLEEDFYKVMRFVAGIFHKEKRCEEVLSYVDSCKADLDKRTKDIPDDQRPSVYVGAVTFSGGHGFAGTCAHYGPFMAIHANNVVDQTGEKSTFEIDLEKVALWDPQFVFLDPRNMNLVNEEYKSNPGFFNNLTAVQNDHVYTAPSHICYHVNATNVLLNAYFIGKTIYPEQFKDIDIRAKGGEIREMFLGRDYFDQMTKDGYFYGKLHIGE